ncbi:MAG: START domain-containing protein [Bacteroidales bacterium]
MMLPYFLSMLFSFSLLYHTGTRGDEWKLIKDSERIKVYIKKQSKNNNYVNIRATTKSKGSLEIFGAIMQDVPNYDQWMHSVKKTTVVEKKSDYHFSYYMLTDFPWPAKDRDVVLDMQFEWVPEENIFTTHSKNVNGAIPEKEDIIRIEEVNASYAFTRLKNNRIRIEYKGKINPGVNLPEWLKEKVYQIAPYNTLKNLREYAQESKYEYTDFNLNEI